jgi:hypothetical protein
MARSKAGRPEDRGPRVVTSAGPSLVWESDRPDIAQLALRLGGDQIEELAQRLHLPEGGGIPEEGGVDGSSEER